MLDGGREDWDRRPRNWAIIANPMDFGMKALARILTI
jgi:hypothetical protein